MPEKQRQLSTMNVLLALALLLLATIIGREVIRQRAVSPPVAPVSPASVSASPTVEKSPGSVVDAGTRPPVAPAEVQVGPRLAAAPAAPPPVGREIPDSRLDRPRDAQRVLRAQTRALREEAAADTLDPARRRALSLTQDEILKIEKDERLIF